MTKTWAGKTEWIKGIISGSTTVQITNVPLISFDKKTWRCHVEAWSREPQRPPVSLVKGRASQHQRQNQALRPPARSFLQANLSDLQPQKRSLRWSPFICNSACFFGRRYFRKNPRHFDIFSVFEGSSEDATYRVWGRLHRTPAWTKDLEAAIADHIKEEGCCCVITQASSDQSRKTQHPNDLHWSLKLQTCSTRNQLPVEYSSKYIY